MGSKPGLNNWQLLDTKLDNFGKTNRLLEKAVITEDDIDKIFYSDPKKKVGQIVNNEKFLKMNPNDIGGWVRIGELDVNV